MRAGDLGRLSASCLVKVRLVRCRSPKPPVSGTSWAFSFIVSLSLGVRPWRLERLRGSMATPHITWEKITPYHVCTTTDCVTPCILGTRVVRSSPEMKACTTWEEFNNWVHIHNRDQHLTFRTRGPSLYLPQSTRGAIPWRQDMKAEISADVQVRPCVGSEDRDSGGTTRTRTNQVLRNRWLPKVQARAPVSSLVSCSTLQEARSSSEHPWPSRKIEVFRFLEDTNGPADPAIGSHSGAGAVPPTSLFILSIRNASSPIVG